MALQDFFGKSQGRQRADQALIEAEDRLMAYDEEEGTNLANHAKRDAARTQVIVARQRSSHALLKQLSEVASLSADDFTKARVASWLDKRFRHIIARPALVADPAEWSLCPVCHGKCRNVRGSDCDECWGGGFLVTLQRPAGADGSELPEVP